ncbi:MAG: lipase family protein [Planctomycetota bacterium]
MGSRRTVWLLAAGTLLLGGCQMDANNAAWIGQPRMEAGLVLVLPGIEGVSTLNHRIREGLKEAGVPAAMPIYAWGRPLGPLAPLINQVDVRGNRAQARRLAKVILDYQEAYPDRPVWIVGHSGGGAMAVFVAEALPPERPIDGLVLLSPSLSRRYDLGRSLRRCRRGIVNFYNPRDVALLGVGTTLLTNVDGARGLAGGLTGFTAPADPERQRLYAEKLHQIGLGPDLTGGYEPHSSATHPEFVAEHVAPWVAARNWPALQDAHIARGP